MTSPSRRKHQITASVRRRRTSPDRISAASTLAHELADTKKRSAEKRLVSVFSSAIVFVVLLTEVATAQQQIPEKFARPRRFTPPVHATPIPGQQQQLRQQHYQDAAPAARNRTQNRELQNRDVRRPLQQPTRQVAQHQQMATGQHDAQAQRIARGRQVRADQRFPVRQAAATQEFDGSIGDQPPSFNQIQQPAVDQWRTRNDQAVRETTEALHSVMQDMGRDSQRFSDVATPDPSMPTNGIQNPEPQYDLPVPRSNRSMSQQPRQIPDYQQVPDQPDYGSYETPRASFDDQDPGAMQSDPFDSYITEESENRFRNGNSSDGQSVLVRDQPVSDNNTLRDLQIEPQRRHNGQLNRNTTMQSRYRSTPGYGNYRQEEDEGGFGDEEENQARGGKSCEEFRAELLNNPITDIIVDISPGRPSAAAQDIPYGITRTWTDCTGNALGTGTLSSLQRNYIVIADETGASQHIPMSQLSDGDLAIVTEFWVLPNECSLGCYPYEGRQWACSTVFWKASSLCHKPLYFENQQLERYGHTHGPIVQPIHSTAHFFVSLFLYPYNSKINPPNECLYSVGYYRPGDCAPWLKDPFPLSLAGAIKQGAVIGGAAAILP